MTMRTMRKMKTMRTEDNEDIQDNEDNENSEDNKYNNDNEENDSKYKCEVINEKTNVWTVDLQELVNVSAIKITTYANGNLVKNIEVTLTN